MEITYISTLDGKTEVQWWEKEHFKYRCTQIYSARGLEADISIPDDCVLCDFCNTDITEFPVPVVCNYALCEECFESMKKEE